MTSFLHSLVTVAVSIVTAVSGFFGYHASVPAVPASNHLDIYRFAATQAAYEAEQSQKLGASNAIPTVIALFETSLSSAITSSATSFTLTSARDLSGTTLASSTYAFIIDEGTASQELVIADCTGTACTNVARGLSVVTGTTTVTALEHSHRRGASVKITDGPQLNILSRIINGNGTLPNVISYSSHPSFSSGLQIVDKTYVDSGVLAGAATSSETVTGISRLATQLQMASSTDLGIDTPLVLQAKYATSSPGTAGLWAVITNNSGKIAQPFLDWTQNIPFSGNNTYAGTETFNNAVTFNSTTSGLQWQNILSTTTQQTMTYATTSFAGYNALRIYVYEPGAQVDSLCGYFNSDVGTNYSVDAYSRYASVIRTSSNRSFATQTGTATTTEIAAIIDVPHNVSSKGKTFTWTQTDTDATSDHASLTLTGSGYWNNTSAQITGFVLNGSASCNGGNIVSGTTINVYGAN